MARQRETTAALLLLALSVSLGAVACGALFLVGLQVDGAIDVSWHALCVPLYVFEASALMVVLYWTHERLQSRRAAERSRAALTCAALFVVIVLLVLATWLVARVFEAQRYVAHYDASATAQLLPLRDSDRPGYLTLAFLPVYLVIVFVCVLAPVALVRHRWWSSSGGYGEDEEEEEEDEEDDQDALWKEIARREAAERKEAQERERRKRAADELDQRVRQHVQHLHSTGSIATVHTPSDVDAADD